MLIACQSVLVLPDAESWAVITDQNASSGKCTGAGQWTPGRGIESLKGLGFHAIGEDGLTGAYNEIWSVSLQY